MRGRGRGGGGGGGRTGGRGRRRGIRGIPTGRATLGHPSACGHHTHETHNVSTHTFEVTVDERSTEHNHGQRDTQTHQTHTDSHRHPVHDGPTRRACGCARRNTRDMRMTIADSTNTSTHHNMRRQTHILTRTDTSPGPTPTLKNTPRAEVKTTGDHSMPVTTQAE